MSVGGTVRGLGPELEKSEESSRHARMGIFSFVSVCGGHVLAAQILVWTLLQ